MHTGRHSNHRGEKEKAYIHLAFQQNKQLGVQTVVIVISAVVVSERNSLIWHNKTYMQSSPARTQYLLETFFINIYLFIEVHNTRIAI